MYIIITHFKMLQQLNILLVQFLLSTNIQQQTIYDNKQYLSRLKN